MSESSDKLLDLATTQLTNIIETAKNTAPKVTETVLMITSYGRLIHVVTFFVVLLLSVIPFYVSRLMYLKAMTFDWYEDSRAGYTVAWVLACGLGVLLFGIGFSNLLDFWSWVGIWHPDLYLAHEMIQRLTESNSR